MMIMMRIFLVIRMITMHEEVVEDLDHGNDVNFLVDQIVNDLKVANDVDETLDVASRWIQKHLVIWMLLKL